MPIRRFAIVKDSEEDTMPAAPRKPIGKYILRVMEEKNLKAKDVLVNAERLKIDLKQPTFQNIYSGQIKNPGVFTLIDISKSLGRPFVEMAAELEGGAVDMDAFRGSQFAALWQMYDQLNAANQEVADHFVEMVKRELSELLTQQGETNLRRLRK